MDTGHYIFLEVDSMLMVWLIFRGITLSFIIYFKLNLIEYRFICANNSWIIVPLNAGIYISPSSNTLSASYRFF